MLLKLKIWWLKRRLRRMIISFNQDYSDHNGGNHITGIISGGLYCRRKADIETVKDKLRAIDPNYPKPKP